MLGSLLPWKKLLLKSPLDREEALRRLEAAIEPPRTGWAWGYKGSGNFCGTLSGGRFRLRRDIAYRNSFLPVVEGEIAGDESGSRISIYCHMHIAVTLFLAVWLSFAFAIPVSIIFSALHKGQAFEPDMLIPFGLFLFGIVLPVAAFYPESRIAEKFLYRTFDVPLKKSTNG